MEVAHLKLRSIKTRQLKPPLDSVGDGPDYPNGGSVQHANGFGDLKHHGRADDETNGGTAVFDNGDNTGNLVFYDDYHGVDENDDDKVNAMANDDDGACTIDEPVTPAGRFFLHPSFNAHILVIMGSKIPINIDALKSGLRDSIIKHQRFSSIIRKNDKGDLYWEPTSVNLDEHVVVVEGDSKSQNFVEEYVTQLMQASPLNPSRPLFEFHVLNVRLGEAAGNVVLRVHHALGDGTSLMSLLLACTRKVKDPESLPTLPTQALRSGKKGSRFEVLFLLLWRFLVMLWYTLVDVCSLLATMMWMEDSITPIKGFRGVEKLSKRLAHRTVSMDDIRRVKQAIHGTVNDVVYGMVAAGISRYLHERYDELMDEGNPPSKKLHENKSTSEIQERKEMLARLRVRACILVNTRPSPGLQELDKMMKGGSQARWGNHMGYVILPVPLSASDNPLDYAISSKSIIDKKKKSLGARFSYKSATMLMHMVGLEMPTRLTLKCTANTTLSFSNVSGPLEEIEFFGHPITHIIPTVAGQPQALCVHVQSYMDKATIVASTVKDVIPDPEKLCEHMVCALQEMKARLHTSEVEKPEL